MEHPAGAPQRPEASKKEALPRQFGKYTLLRHLASGGMAEVFLALQRSVAGFEKLVVIKRILPSMNDNKAFIDMLLHEARIAATLSHPNIVQTFDVGQTEGSYFIAMEHIHGEDLQGIVKAMKRRNLSEFPIEHTLGIAIGMCAGLAYAHEKRDLEGKPLGIVHRDISPRNIVVSFTGEVKIVDFGVAKSGLEPGEESGAGQLKGKAPYMSPEQASGHEIDARSDVFAAGVMLFELTTGKRLFKGSSEFETLKLIVDKEYPRPSAVRPGYPPGLEHIVMRALEKDRERRYQSAREMQAELETFVREERVPVSTVSLIKWMEYLFEDKLAQQKEALSDVKQLADVIAAQQTPPPPSQPQAGVSSTSLYQGDVSTGTGPTNSATALPSIPPPKRSNAAPIAAVLFALVLVGGGVLWVRHEDERRAANEAEAEAKAKEVGTAAPAEPPARKRGSLDLATKPDGCAIWIDGDLRPETTPAHIDKLPLGKPIQLKLTKEGFEAYRADVTIAEDEPAKKLAVEMKSGSVTVLLKIEPPATIWLDGKPWKGARDTIDGLSAGEEHKIVVTANGYQPKTYTINAQQGETKTITDNLVKEGGVAAPGPAAVPTGPPGKVRVGAKGGFCNVSVNGASYGPTPVEAVVVSGTVKVSCKPADGPAQQQTVSVGPGETARVWFKVD
jgi:serine/threonine-protein kinase